MLTQQNDLMVTFYEILLVVLGFHRIFWKGWSTSWEIQIVFEKLKQKEANKQSLK